MEEIKDLTLKEAEFSKKNIVSMIDRYAASHPEVTPGQRKFLSRIKMEVWKLLPPTNLDCGIVKDHEEAEYDLSKYIKLFLANPYRPTEMAKYKAKYQRLRNLTRNYQFIVYKKTYFDGSGRYYWPSWRSYGYGLKVDGTNKVYPIACFNDIKNSCKRLEQADSDETYNMLWSGFEVLSKYDSYSDLKDTHPEFDGTQKFVTKKVHELQLRNKELW